jgi:hypothetical protein
MNTFKTFGLAAVAALSLGVGAAMAQEGPNDRASGATFFQAQPPAMGHQAAVSSGSSDVDTRAGTNSQWHPGQNYNNGGGDAN